MKRTLLLAVLLACSTSTFAATPIWGRYAPGYAAPGSTLDMPRLIPQNKFQPALAVLPAVPVITSSATFAIPARIGVFKEPPHVPAFVAPKQPMFNLPPSPGSIALKNMNHA